MGSVVVTVSANEGNVVHSILVDGKPVDAPVALVLGDQQSYVSGVTTLERLRALLLSVRVLDARLHDALLSVLVPQQQQPKQEEKEDGG